MLYFMALAGIVEAAGGIFGDPVALIQLSQQQAAGIRCYLATLKIGDDFLRKRLSKRSCLWQTVFKGYTLPEKVFV